jgi:hypothetical protein
MRARANVGSWHTSSGLRPSGSGSITVFAGVLALGQRRESALEAIDRSEKAIKDLRSTTRNDRKAFAVYLLHKKRR